MRAVDDIETEVGPASLATKTCDECGFKRSDDVLGWLTVERDPVIIGQADRLDFCSEPCLERYAAKGRLR